MGVKPPMAQSEPSVMVWHRSSSSARLLSRLSPATILSMVSTPARRADAAGRALAAGFNGAEFHGEAGLLGHVDGVVKHHDAAVADHGAIGGEGFIVHRQVKLRGWNIGAERAAHLHGAQWLAREGAAAEIIDQLAERDAKRLLHQSALLDIACELEGQGAARPAHAEILVGRATLRP